MTHEKHKRGAEVIRRWRLQALLPCFDRWKEYVHERRQHKHQLMRSALIRLQHAKLWAGWSRWTRFVEHSQVAQLRLHLTQEKHKRKAVVIHKWRLQALLPTFHAWKEYTRERKHHKTELLKRTLRRWLRAELWRYVAHSPSGVVCLERDSHLCVCVCVSHACCCVPSSGWRVWSHFVEMHKVAGLKSKMVLERAKRKQEVCGHLSPFAFLLPK